MATKPETNPAAGEPISSKNQVLQAGASAIQDFAPLRSVCAHLNAFHAYAADPSRAVEANHYCGHVNDEVRQCILYDSPEANARIIGVEYMITPRLYESLDAGERGLWHSHVYEVKSGMLIMPQATLPEAMWQTAENEEMAEVVRLYGKVYHLWQVDRGDELPLGEPQLMTSFTAPGQLDFERRVAERDRRFKSDYKRKQEARKHIASPAVHPDADQTWKRDKEAKRGEGRGVSNADED
ncbi:Oil body-associated protein 1A [Colletotrichum spinosum]|uniref:Oil body-associated protein 1A n=1 Tax=Colletotrichum spinosum TaxID=1347390 RepID=A0A4R8PTY6_9PEZI|nr:Oil body-associated protein 1A [Colletotrichum spinosum]